MNEIGRHSWHARLFAWSYTAFNQKPPQQFDRWLYGTTVLGALVFVACAIIICIVLNALTLFLGVFVEPIWRPDARFRHLRLSGGIPIIAVAVPLWLAIAAWKNWAMYGIAHTLGPFVVTAFLAFAMLGCFVLFNTTRRKLPTLSFRDKGPAAGA